MCIYIHRFQDTVLKLPREKKIWKIIPNYLQTTSAEWSGR